VEEHRRGSTGESPFAAVSGMASASREKADASLDEQIALSRKQFTIADLQIEDLKREDKLRHWSLIVHHFSDVLKLAFEFAVVVAITARAGGDGGATATGAESGMDGLLQQAAENIYGRTQPYRYAVYALLVRRSRWRERAVRHCIPARSRAK
jgi:hypothetical protein